MANNNDVHNPIVGLTNSAKSPDVAAAQHAAQAQAAKAEAQAQQPKVTTYTMGNVPHNAQAASKDTANASYTDPYTGQTYYYNVPSGNGGGGNSGGGGSSPSASSGSSGEASSSESSAVPPGFTPQTWAFQKEVYTSQGIAYNPSTGLPIRATGGQPSVGAYLSSGGTSSPSQSSRASSSTSTAPAGAGLNQLPQSIATELQSGTISSWTNPNTGQTFYAPNTIGNGNTIWVRGPNGSGPITMEIGGSPIQITTNTVSGQLQQPQEAVRPQGLSGVDYETFGTSADVSWTDSHSGTFYITVSLPNGQSFQYGTASNPMQVSGVPLGSVNAQDAAVSQAWSAYMAAEQSLQNVPAGSVVTVTQGKNGLQINVNSAKASTLPTQTVQVASGLTVTEPTDASMAVAAAPFLNSAFLKSVSPTETYNSPYGISFKGSELLSMYTNYEGQIASSLGAENPIVTVGSTTANFNSLTAAQQSQYVQQETDQYTQTMALGYTGPGYYTVNGKNVYLNNQGDYTTLLQKGQVAAYQGGSLTAPQEVPTTTTAPTTPTFTSSSGTGEILLPQGWSVDSTTGDLSVSGNKPTLQQSEQYANAYSQYLNWYQANNPSASTEGSASSAQAPPMPMVPNWYTQLQDSPQGGAYMANLASFQYAPAAPALQPPTATSSPIQEILELAPDLSTALQSPISIIPDVLTTSVVPQPAPKPQSNSPISFSSVALPQMNGTPNSSYTTTSQGNTLTNTTLPGTGSIYALPQGTTEALGISIPQPETQTSYIDTQAKALGLTPAVYMQNMQAQEQLATQPSVAQQLENMYWPASTNAAPQSSYTAISQGNTLTALPTPGAGGQSNLQLAGPLSSEQPQNTGLSNQQRLPLRLYNQSVPNTNIAQVSSFAPPVNSYTYHSITPNTPASQSSPFLSAITAYPGYIASTVGGLVNWALTPYGFTPGGAPLAGGQFPNNYPFTQEGINP